MDMLTIIYNALVADSFIFEKTNGNIKFYEFPSTSDFQGTRIIIDPLDVPIPSDYADGTWLTDDYIYQIEVWSTNRNETKEISNQIRSVMWRMDFYQFGGTDEWDKDYNIFRDARRYRGKAYREDLGSL